MSAADVLLHTPAFKEKCNSCPLVARFSLLASIFEQSNIAHTYTYTHTYTHTHTHTHTRIYTHTHTHANYTHEHVSLRHNSHRTYVHDHTHIIRTYTNTYRHSHTRIPPQLNLQLASCCPFTLALLLFFHCPLGEVDMWGYPVL